MYHGTSDVCWLFHSSSCWFSIAWPGCHLPKLPMWNFKKQRFSQFGSGESRKRVAERMSGNFIYFLFHLYKLFFRCFVRPSKVFVCPPDLCWLVRVFNLSSCKKHSLSYEELNGNCSCGKWEENTSAYICYWFNSINIKKPLNLHLLKSYTI